MSKKLKWPEAKITSSRAAGTYGSYREFLQKAQAVQAQQQEAREYMAKAMPGMLKLLEMRMVSREPLKVMRPLGYMSSEIPGQEEDDGFYKSSPSQNQKFVDVRKVVHPGTELVFKSLDPNLREFIFDGSDGKEHAISFDERNVLLTQTDIFETIKNYFEGTGE